MPLTVSDNQAIQSSGLAYWSEHIMGSNESKIVAKFHVLKRNEPNKTNMYILPTNIAT